MAETEATAATFLGIDPGVDGSIAVIALRDGKGALTVHDMPRAGKRVDALGLFFLLDMLLPLDGTKAQAAVEEVHSMPSDGHVGAFSFGHSAGVLKGVLAGHDARVAPLFVHPRAWKEALRVPADKEKARARASALLACVDPSCERLWPRKKDHNRAEAALLALYSMCSN